jgi:predicted metal-dependent hydrolase
MEEIKIDKLIRSKRKTISLSVTASSTLVVRAPFYVPIGYIKSLVLKKYFWIKAKKKEASKCEGVVIEKKFINGEDFLYLGKTYKLKIKDCEQIELSECLSFPNKFLNNPRLKMIEWYKEKALQKIKERADLFSNNTGWKYKKINITSAKTRWGSCSSTGSINFTWRLIMTPLEIIDYVVVHELAHVPEKNHSSLFWDKVKSVLPDYKEREKWLKTNRKSLNI